MEKEKKTINILTVFFISHKSDVKTFFNWIFNQCLKGTCQHFSYIYIYIYILFFSQFLDFGNINNLAKKNLYFLDPLFLLKFHFRGQLCACVDAIHCTHCPYIDLASFSLVAKNIMLQLLVIIKQLKQLGHSIFSK